MSFNTEISIEVEVDGTISGSGRDVEAELHHVWMEWKPMWPANAKPTRIDILPALDPATEEQLLEELEESKVSEAEAAYDWAMECKMDQQREDGRL